MHRHVDSRSSNRFSRRKSASSTYTRPVPIDPVISRHHAQAAATYAFARAEERKSVDIRLNTITLGENKMFEHRRSSSLDNPAGQDTRGVRRRQSVRFVRPNTVRSQQPLEKRLKQEPISDKTCGNSLRPTALANEVPVPAVYRPPSRSSSIGRASVSKGTVENYMTTLAAYDEYYTKEDDIASTPSSYRRIRKSKSAKTLFSPIKSSSILFSNETPDSDYNDRILNKVPWIQNQGYEPILKAPKSMSFLRGGRDYMSASMRQDRDDAVQIARDKFLHQIEQQRLREQPSFLFRAKAWKEPKPFRQSVRGGSIGSHGISIGSAIPVVPQKQGSLRVKARKASNSIKRALQNLFRRSGGDQDEATAQKIGASKQHSSSQRLEDLNSLHRELSDIPQPDSIMVSRAGSRISSLHSVASAQQLRSNADSVRSLRSEGSNKSRVTSWTSTVDNTSNNRHAQAERERQRLSIIQENGTHTSSSSFKRPAISNQFSAYPAFHRPRNPKDSVTSVPGLVDSQRVYSALMKRLDENSPKAILNAQHGASVENFENMKRIPPRNSSVGSHHSSNKSRASATIRHVSESCYEPSGSKEKCGKSLTSTTHDTGDVFCPKPGSESSSPAGNHQIPIDTKIEASAIRQNLTYDIYPVMKINDGKILSPQQIAARNELFTKPSRTRRETRSTFFGQPSFTIRRSTSPYRRALAGADYNLSSVAGETSEGQTPCQILPVASGMSSSAPKEAEKREKSQATDTYTESIYSRSTNGRTPPAQSFRSLNLHEDDLSPGDKTALVSQARPNNRSARPNRRGFSSNSSQEWKGWLSAEVSALGNDGVTEALIKIDYALPTMPNSFGHVREHAQITEEDTQVSQCRVNMTKQRVEIVQQTTQQPIQLKSTLKQKSSVSSITIQPPPTPPPPPPPVPTHLPLRVMQSRNPFRPIDTMNTQGTLSAPSSTVKLASLTTHQQLPPRSSTTISSTNTPAKLVKRNRRPSNHSKSSPGIGAAVDKQFGSGNSRTSFRGTENRSPVDDSYGSDGAALMLPNGLQQLDPQAMGSKRMVDLFLSSRRKRVAGSDEGNAFL